MSRGPASWPLAVGVDHPHPHTHPHPLSIFTYPWAATKGVGVGVRVSVGRKHCLWLRHRINIAHSLRHYSPTHLGLLAMTSSLIRLPFQILIEPMQKFLKHLP